MTRDTRRHLIRQVQAAIHDAAVELQERLGPPPTVHLNGSGRENLDQQYRAITDALSAALDALQAATPHGRDYYVQADPDALAKAQAAHRSRTERVLEVLDEIRQLHMRVMDPETTR